MLNVCALMLADIAGLVLGNQHSMLLGKDGSVWSTVITLRRLATTDKVVDPFIKVIEDGAMLLAAGVDFSLVLKQDGSVWGMGRNSRGQLGDGTRVAKEEFLFVQLFPGAKGLVAGACHSLIVTEDGRVLATGWNKYGQLGDSLTSYRTRFLVSLSTGTKATAVAAGDMYSIALKEDGSVWGAGWNYHGQLGDGSRDDRHQFVEVMSSGAVYIAAGSCHSLVVKRDGSVWTTGCNEFGQLGDGSEKESLNYVQVVVSEVKAASAGKHHSMLLKLDGSVWAAGANQCGQLGYANLVSSSMFVKVISDGATAIAAGGYHTMVLKQDGSVWVTGSNKEGQFGDGTTNSERKFIKSIPYSAGVEQYTMTWAAASVVYPIRMFCNKSYSPLCVYIFIPGLAISTAAPASVTVASTIITLSRTSDLIATGCANDEGVNWLKGKSVFLDIFGSKGCI